VAFFGLAARRRVGASAGCPRRVRRRVDDESRRWSQLVRGVGLATRTQEIILATVSLRRRRAVSAAGVSWRRYRRGAGGQVREHLARVLRRRGALELRLGHAWRLDRTLNLRQVVFGNCGWGTPGASRETGQYVEPLGSRGAVLWPTSAFEKFWEAADVIDDVYAATLLGEGLWATTYVDFPIRHLYRCSERAFPTSDAGPKAICHGRHPGGHPWAVRRPVHFPVVDPGRRAGTASRGGRQALRARR
jgi:hypothetical protein